MKEFDDAGNLSSCWCNRPWVEKVCFAFFTPLLQGSRLRLACICHPVCRKSPHIRKDPELNRTYKQFEMIIFIKKIGFNYLNEQMYNCNSDYKIYRNSNQKVPIILNKLKSPTQKGPFSFGRQFATQWPMYSEQNPGPQHELSPIKHPLPMCRCTASLIQCSLCS